MIEDIVSAFLLCFLGIYYIQRPVINTIFIAQLSIIIIPLIVAFAYIAGNLLNSATFLLILKQIVYFTIALATYYFITQKKSHYLFLMRLIEALFIINIVYSLISLAIGNFTFYGIGTIAEGAPAQSGIFYFFSTLFFLCNLSQRKHLSNELFFISLILLIATVSRTSIIAGVFVIILYTVFYSSLKFKLKVFACLVLLVVIVLNFLADKIDFILYIIGRLERVLQGSALLQRQNHLQNWIMTYPTFNWYNYLFGFGYFSFDFFSGLKEYKLSADSFYVRIFYETGLAGIVAWVYMFFKLYTPFVFVNTNIAIFMKLCIIGILMMCFTHEILYLAKPAEIFFLIVIANYAYFITWQSEDRKLVIN